MPQVADSLHNLNGSKMQPTAFHAAIGDRINIIYWRKAIVRSLTGKGIPFRQAEIVQQGFFARLWKPEKKLPSFGTDEDLLLYKIMQKNSSLLHTTPLMMVSPRMQAVSIRKSTARASSIKTISFFP